MSYFAAVLSRDGDVWTGEETSLAECESLDDLVEILRDAAGAVRLLLVEQDDEYAAIVRLDEGDDEPRAFLSEGHAADRYPKAALIAEDLVKIGPAPEDDEDDPEALLDADAPPARDGAPLGDAEVVDDLGTPATELIAMCEHEGTLPVDLLLAVCEKAGCGEVFEDLRG